MRVALVQLNPTVGDVAGNLAAVERAYFDAVRLGADLCVFPELTLLGYPPKDLLDSESMVVRARVALDEFARSTRRTAAIVGFADQRPRVPVGRRLFNAAAICMDGRVAAVHHKSLLPNYDVFDERRYFEPAEQRQLWTYQGRRFGITICEDMWNDATFWPERLYALDPVAELVELGADVIINLSASPFSLRSRHVRPEMVAALAKRHRRPVLFCNQVGGQDDLVFDGRSMAFGPDGELWAQGAELAEDVVFVDLDRRGTQPGSASVAVSAAVPDAANLTDAASPTRAADPTGAAGALRAAGATDLSKAPASMSGASSQSDEAASLAALTLGVRDYALRCGFRTAVVGLSGGIDSALVAAIAVRALGVDAVWGVGMPSRYSSEGSVLDAKRLADNLGIHWLKLPIETPHAAFLSTLGPIIHPSGGATGGSETEENLQARVRGMLLMALSNRFGHLVLSTGNKSELAVGYCTLYGDMCGGLSVISDVPKTMVYRLCEEVNRQADGELIPRAIFTKAPSAELRPNQTDQDTLPPYELLDRILEAHIEQGLDSQQLVAEGFDPAIVTDIVRRVRVNEYKRRQAAPGLRITAKAFGTGRRMPIARGGE